MNASAAYHPNAFVQYGAVITRLSMQLHTQGGGTTSCALALTPEYATCVVGVAGFLLGFGLASMVLMTSFILLRRFFPSLRCMPDFRESHIEREIAQSGVCCWSLPLKTAFDAKSSEQESILLAALKRKRLARFAYSIPWFSIPLLACLVLVYVANDSMDRAVAKAQQSLASLRSAVGPFAADAGVLLGQSGLVAKALSSLAQPCGNAQGAADTLRAQVSDFASLISSATTNLGVVQHAISAYVGDIRHYSVACLGFIPALFAAGFPYLTRKKERVPILKLLMAAAVLYYYLCVIAGFFVVFLVSGLGDFAVDPYQRLLNIVPGGDLRTLTSYYTTCAGGSALDAMMVSAQVTADSLHGLLGGGGCPASDASAAMANASALISATLRNRGHGPGVPCTAMSTPGVAHTPVACVLDLPDCPAIRAMLTDFVDAIVDLLYPGLLELSLTLLWCSFLLWMLVVLSSLLYPHFDGPVAQVHINYYTGHTEEDVAAHMDVSSGQPGHSAARAETDGHDHQKHHQHGKSRQHLNRVAAILTDSSEGLLPGANPLGDVGELDDESEEEAVALRIIAKKLPQAGV